MAHRRTPDLHMLGAHVKDPVEDPAAEAVDATRVMMNGLLRRLRPNFAPLDDKDYAQFSVRLEALIIQTVRSKFDEWRP
jgi:hypothetical protein